MSASLQTLSHLLDHIDFTTPEWMESIDGISVDRLANDTREEFSSHTMFIAINGYDVDGHRFCQAAVDRGASVLLVDHEVETDPRVPQIIVKSTREILPLVADRFFGHPSQSLNIVAVTGTNGKTTTTFILEGIFQAAGLKSGRIGTLGVSVDGKPFEAVSQHRTTPGPLQFHEILAQLRDDGVTHVAIEASSHGLVQGRLDENSFVATGFSNLTEDHLDFHKTMENYYQAKKLLFTRFDSKAKVINIDPEYGQRLYHELADAKAQGMLSVSSQHQADIWVDINAESSKGADLSLHFPDSTHSLRLPLIGHYNVDNALLAAGLAYSIGISAQTITQALQNAPQVPGRQERIDEGQDFDVFVDYAHTPDGITNALSALKPLTAGRLIAVFGAGGDRDPQKRPIMAQAAGELADLTVITSDNPRTEDPAQIAADVEKGIKDSCAHYEVILDRHRAIADTVAQARPGDVIAILGKGPEEYLEVGHEFLPWDDRQEARDAIATALRQ